jgi:hypothetical protein
MNFICNIYFNTETYEVTKIYFSEASREGGDDSLIKAEVEQLKREIKLSQLFT